MALAKWQPMEKLGIWTVVGIIALVQFAARAEPVKQPPPIPAKWLNYVYHDIYFNTWNRKGTPAENVHGDKPGTTRPLYYFEIPIKSPNDFSGQHYNLEYSAPLTSIAHRSLENAVFFFEEKPAALKLRMYLVGNEIEKHALDVDRLGGAIGLQQDQWRIKLRSNGTYFVWSAKGKPFQIKEVLKGDPSESNSKLMETLSSDSVRSFPISFFPEYGAMAVSNLDLQLKEEHYVVRPLEDVLGKKIPVGFMPEPLHGVLDESSNIMARLARAAGMSVHQWRQEIYIPELARLVAECQYRLGIFHNSHTQNLVPFVNYQTGEIILVLRDLRDIYWDYRLLQKFYPQALRYQKQLPRIVMNKSPFENPELIKGAMTPGLQFKLYTFQSIASVTSDKVEQALLTQIFAEQFLNNVSRITGVQLRDSLAVRTILNRLIEATANRQFQYEFQLKSSGRELIMGLDGAAAHLVQVVYDEVLSRQIQFLRKSLVKGVPAKNLEFFYMSLFPHSQSALTAVSADVISERLKMGRGLKFELLGNQILVSNAMTGEPLSLSESLENFQICQRFLLPSALH